MEQLESQLPAADVTFSADVLDRIDAVIAPGVTISPEESSYGEMALEIHCRRWKMSRGTGLVSSLKQLVTEERSQWNMNEHTAGVGDDSLTRQLPLKNSP